MSITTDTASQMVMETYLLVLVEQFCFNSLLFLMQWIFHGSGCYSFEAMILCHEEDDVVGPFKPFLSFQNTGLKPPGTFCSR